MTKEIEFLDGPAGLSVYAVLMGRAKVWDGVAGAFVEPDAGDWANYVITMTELAAMPGYFSGDMPAAAPEGRYFVLVLLRAGAAPASGDPVLGYVPLRWDGAAEVTLDDSLAAADFTEPAIAMGLTAVKARTDNLPADTAAAIAALGSPASPADVLTLLDENVDSTGGAAVTVRKALEAVLAVLAGRADFDAASGAEQFHGRDGVTPVVTTQIQGNGKRTASTIS